MHVGLMIHLSGQPCQICRSIRSDLLWTTTWPEHRYPGPFSMHRCAGCGLLFNSPRLDDVELSQLYGRNYYFFSRTDAREFSRIVPMYQRTVGLVADQVREKRLLDIGCGRGYLPAVLRELRWDARGVELSAAASEYARQRFGLDVFTGTIDEYASSSNAEQFPLVTAIDVIEHVPSPAAFIAAIAQAVEPGGRVILDTPNAAAQNIQSKHLEWSGFNPFHIFLFTVQNLKTLLEGHGFVVERAFSYNNSPQTVSLRDMAARTLKRAGLLGPAARAYFRLKGFASSNGRPAEHLARAVEQIRTLPPWDATSDASAPLAAENAGDNIVVIARRPDR